MISVILQYIKESEDVYHIEDGYLLLETKKYYPTIDYQEDYNIFTFTIDENTKYTMRIDNKAYNCFTQPLNLINENNNLTIYEIIFEEVEKEISYCIYDDEDSCG